MKCAGVILCGGKSRRMGYPKGMLPFGDELMLRRVARIINSVVEPVVVVAATGQELPELPADTIIVRDRKEDRGPLEGIAAGLSAVRDMADAAYVTGCDVPLLSAPFVATLIQLLEEYDIVVPREEKYHHPLAAVYRTSVLKDIETLLAADRVRPVFLFSEVDTREVPVAQLRSVDPDLRSLANLNRPEDYLRALRIAGLPLRDDVRRRLER